MKYLLLALFCLPQLSFAAPTYRVDTQKESALKQTHKPMKTTDPSALPCIPQQTQDEKLQDLVKLEYSQTHSTNCPADGAIKTMPGDKKQNPAAQPENPAEVR